MDQNISHLLSLADLAIRNGNNEEATKSIRLALRAIEVLLPDCLFNEAKKGEDK